MSAAALSFEEICARDNARFIDRYRHRAQDKASAFGPSLESHLMNGWESRIGITRPGNGSPVAVANLFVNQLHVDMKRSRVSGAAYDEQRIRAHAENYSALCGRMASLGKREEFARSVGITPPQGRTITAEGARRRLEDAMWWRRQLRKVWTRAAEDAMRAAGIIRKGRAPYASDEAVAHRQARQLRTREWLESRAMVSEDGEQLDLLPLAEKSMANPALRNKEFMVRSRGFDEIARDMGHGGIFATLTAPSAFHAQLSKGGANPRWDAADRPRIRDAHAWLCGMWAKVRAKLHRLSIAVYGFRVAEPHHDGTPHWHVALCMPLIHMDAVKLILREHWLSEYGDEPGAQDRRVVIMDIDWERGGMAGYLSKYFAKNLDGSGSIAAEDDDETGEAVSASVARVVAWASIHGIRQFQQLGGPPVGLWRELRRLRDPVSADVIEAARLPADGAQWKPFINALGGMDRARRRVRSLRGTYKREVTPPMVRVYRAAKRQGKGPAGYRVAKRQPAPEVFTAIVRERRKWTKLARTLRPALPHEMPTVWMDRAEPRATDRQGREVMAVTSYGEQPGMRAAGVCSFGLLGRFASVNTRPHRWRIERKASDACPGGTGRTAATAYLGRSASTAPMLSSESSRDSASRSDLGPVAITVRGPDRSAGMDFSWVATVPYRTQGDPRGWTSRETSMAGPFNA